MGILCACLATLGHRLGRYVGRHVGGASGSKSYGNISNPAYNSESLRRTGKDTQTSSRDVDDESSSQIELAPQGTQGRYESGAWASDGDNVADIDLALQRPDAIHVKTDLIQQSEGR